MKISSLQNNKKRDNTSFNASHKALFLPKAIGEFGKIVGEYVSIPEQKLVQSTTALFLQPQIDLKYAEEDKKIDTAIKSASKAIAGGLTGVTIRGLTIGFFKKYIKFYSIEEKMNLSKFASKMDDLFVPKLAKELYDKKPSLATYQLKKYNETLGTIAAIVIMTMFSNAKIDVPLTSDLQDFMSGIIKEKKSWKKAAYDTLTKRKERITSWINKKKHFFRTAADKTKRINKIIKTPAASYKIEEKKK